MAGTDAPRVAPGGASARAHSYTFTISEHRYSAGGHAAVRWHILDGHGTSVARCGYLETAVELVIKLTGVTRAWEPDWWERAVGSYYSPAGHGHK